MNILNVFCKFILPPSNCICKLTKERPNNEDQITLITEVQINDRPFYRPCLTGRKQMFYISAARWRYCYRFSNAPDRWWAVHHWAHSGRALFQNSYLKMDRTSRSIHVFTADFEFDHKIFSKSLLYFYIQNIFELFYQFCHLKNVLEMSKIYPFSLNLKYRRQCPKKFKPWAA